MLRYEVVRRRRKEIETQDDNRRSHDIPHQVTVAQDGPKKIAFTQGRMALKGTHRDNRTPAQRALLSGHMNHVKAATREFRAKQQQEEEVKQAASLLQHRALRCGALIVAQKSRGGFSTLKLKITQKGLAASGGRVKCQLTSYAWLQIVFQEMHISSEAVARRYEVDTKTIRTLRLLMAGIILERARAIPRRICTISDFGACAGFRLSFAMWGLAHDETSRLLTLSLPLPFAAQQRRSSWHVLVSTSTYDVLWCKSSTCKRALDADDDLYVDDDDDHHDAEHKVVALKHLSFDVARPNVPLMGTTAEDLPLFLTLLNCHQTTSILQLEMSFFAPPWEATFFSLLFYVCF